MGDELKSMAIDLYCGLGGWTEGFLAEGYDVVGFDIERHDYGTGGYPGWLVLQDIRTLHGSQFKDAAVIVASPPCQKYSYMAMPWSRAKALAAWYREDASRQVELNELFNACFRIQREASEAAARHIPLIVENVRGAQEWVGGARWHFGSYFLWGDVPALIPPSIHTKLPKAINESIRNVKSPARWTNPAEHHFGRKTRASCGPQIWSNRDGGSNFLGSSQRRAASAQIAKIPFLLANHIAKVFKSQS
jgi:hypothetical protein